MIDPKQHSEGRGWIETFLRFVPGFRGYLEKDYRQESDHLVRTWMADRLQKSKRSLDDYMLGLVDAGLIDQLTSCERAKTRMEGLTLKMRGAVRGYSGFFDYVQVDMELLDKVYEHDMSMVQDVEDLANALSQLAAKPDTSPTAIQDILRLIDDADAKFEQRRDMLAGVGQ
jgi:hypothetical protein